MNLFMYLIWLGVIYLVLYKAFVLKGNFNFEIFTPAAFSLVLSLGNVRAYIQSVSFIILYIFIIFFIFFLEIRTNSNFDSQN